MGDEMLRVFEAFAGIGTQRMALRNLGISHEVVAIAEIDKFAIKSYEAIHGTVNNLGDISKINPDTIPDHDLFTYSFPCQDISVAGKQAGLDIDSGTRSGLLWECQKVIATKKPKYLLMENVKNLVGKKHKPNFDKWLDWLEEQGYTNYWQVLNAKDYGIPQNRERVFCVSILGEHEPYKFPNKQKLTVKLKDILENRVDEKYYLSAEEKTKQLILQDTSVSHMITTDDSKAVVVQKPRGFNKGGLHEVSPSITKSSWQENNFLVHEYRIRKLTPKECWRLMGCSDEDFDKAQSVNSNSQLYKQAGNAIVVDVLEAIFKQLFLTEVQNEY